MNAKPGSKSPRLNEDTKHRSLPKRPRLSTPSVIKSEKLLNTPRRVPKTQYSHEELWKWTLSRDAIAPCRVRDIVEMRECEGGKAGSDPDFFWLGRVPCRIVQFYGLVVGVQTYEARTVYSVDDGSGTIDCNLRHSTQLQFERKSPQKLKAYTKQSNSAMDKHPPKPVAHVGDIVRVVGRVLNRHQTRLINVERLELCRDANVEPKHWLSVSELHKSWYHAVNAAPFTIPPPQPSPECSSVFDPATQGPQGRGNNSRPITQSPSRSSIASSVPSSPCSVASTISSSSQRSPNSPPRLRHPSRLHTLDLTANTFKIYLKHYMDNAPLELTPATSPDTCDSDTRDNFAAQLPQTPTKRPPVRSSRDDMTPRPSNHLPHLPLGGGMETPRAFPLKSNINLDDGDADETSIVGYTLSHLQRVPELALLARRVVEAEAKRRAREERKKQKEREAVKGKARMPSMTAPAPNSTALKEKSGEPRSAKVKRLFKYAIRQLYEEGSIVLWDGAVRRLPLPPIPAPSFTSVSQPMMSTLWKMNSSHSTAGDSTVLSFASQIEEDDGNLSDPSLNEEAYIPLTPSYFAGVVECAIRDMIIARRRVQTSRVKSTSTSGPSAIEIARSLRMHIDGPTPAEIAGFLKRTDERWRRVGEWAVKEALQWASQRGRVWNTGNGKWEICR